MKLVTVKQPWAAAIAFGVVDVINLPRGTRYRGDVFVRAGAQDIQFRPRAGDPLVTQVECCPLRLEYGAIVGVVEVHCVTTPDECQLPFARGPHCALTRNPRVFKQPVTTARISGDAGIIDWPAEEWEDLALPANEWRAWKAAQHPALGPEQFRPSPDGWTGD